MSSLCPEQLSGIALNTWQNLGSPPSLSVQYLVAWYQNSGNLATLNNALTICAATTGDQRCIVGLDDDAVAVFELLYTKQYLTQNQFSLATSIACGGTNAMWTTLREGDSTIQREGIGSAIRSYSQMVAEANKQYRIAVFDYKRNHSYPAMVTADPLASYPTP